MTAKPVPGDLIDNRFDVIRELGEGGFGVVLEVIDRKSKESYAMKVELEVPLPDEPGLDTEGVILRRMQNRQHILRFVFEGKIGGLTYLVMQLAGSNLSELRKRCDGRRFSLSTGTRVAIQTLDAIEVVHESGFLHRDIKPGNFAIGNKGKDRHSVYVLDFGLVRRYKMKDGSVRPPRPSAGFRGSVRYASINCHNHVDLGRRDDLWSWMYAVIEMQKGKLPWSSIESEKKVGSIKTKMKREDLLKKMESAYHYIYQDLELLRYESTPIYDVYKDELRKVLKQRQITDDENFDWEIKKVKVKTRTKKFTKIKNNKSEVSKSENARVTKKSKKEAHSI